LQCLGAAADGRNLDVRVAQQFDDGLTLDLTISSRLVRGRLKFLMRSSAASMPSLVGDLTR
jgi:hypothetical protein